jgi:hypothetical protein
MLYFVIQKRHGPGGWNNAIIRKDTEDEARLQLHGYMFTYAYGKDPELDYVACDIQTEDGRIIKSEIDNRMGQTGTPEMEEE